MANIKIQPDELSSGVAKTITLNTKDTYVLEDIDVIVKPQAGSFNNAPTTGVTYKENTETKTILPENGYLYLNKGWFDNTKISLGHLIPDDANYTNAGVAHILFGYEAYDTDGTKLIGTMATVTPKFDGGGLTVTPSVTGLKNPTVTVSSSGTFKSATTFGVTTTKPSGTDGTSYLTIDGSGTLATSGSVQATGAVTRDAVLYNGATTGYIDKADNTVALTSGTASKTSAAESIGATITDDFAPLYIPIVSVSGTGGGLSKASSGNSVSITGTAPTVTLSYDGKFTDSTIGASYGVTTTKPTTGEDGTDFLKVGVGGTSNTQRFTGSATIKVDRAAVTNSGLKQGAINIADGATLLAGGSDSFTHSNTLDITADVTGGETYYIPIVSLTDKGTGGAVTASASVETAWKPSKLDYIISGTIIDGGMNNYGVSNTAPTSGDYFSLIVHPNLTEHGEVSGTASGTWSRTAVKSNGTYKGAVSLTTDTQFLAAGSGNVDSKTFKQTVDINWDATVGKRDWYFTKANLGNITGGGLSEGTISITGTAPTVTPDINFLSRTNSTDGSAITLTDYGITTSEPTEGDWVVFDPTGSSTTKEYTGSVSVTRNEASVNVTKGLTTGDTKSLTSTSKTYNGKTNITATIGTGTNRYIPVQIVKAVVSLHSVKSPTLDYTENASYFVNGTEQTSLPSGILIEQASNPSDFNTKSYIKITPSAGITKGVSSAKAKGRINAGITKGGVVETSENTKEVDVSISSTKSCFIKVYDGTYSVK